MGLVTDKCAVRGTVAPSTSSPIVSSVAPIIGSAIGYQPIIDVVMHISISGAFPYQFFTFFFLLFYFFSLTLLYFPSMNQCHVVHIRT